MTGEKELWKHGRLNHFSTNKETKYAGQEPQKITPRNTNLSTSVCFISERSSENEHGNKTIKPFLKMSDSNKYHNYGYIQYAIQ